MFNEILLDHASRTRLAALLFRKPRPYYINQDDWQLLLAGDMAVVHEDLLGSLIDCFGWYTVMRSLRFVPENWALEDA